MYLLRPVVPKLESVLAPLVKMQMAWAHLRVFASGGLGGGAKNLHFLTEFPGDPALFRGSHHPSQAPSLGTADSSVVGLFCALAGCSAIPGPYSLKSRHPPPE